MANDDTHTHTMSHSFLFTSQNIAPDNYRELACPLPILRVQSSTLNQLRQLSVKAESELSGQGGFPG